MKIYVINLDGCEDRLSWVSSQLAKLGLEFERFPAITPDTLPTRMSERFLPEADELLLPNEIACFASQLAVAERLLHSSDPHCLVLEDDVEVLCDADALRDLAAASEGYDILRLCTISKRPSVSLGKVGGYEVVRYVDVPYGCGAYFLTRSGARKLLSRAYELAIPYDLFICEEAFLQLNVASVTPAPIPQDRFGQSCLDPEGFRTSKQGKALRRRYFYKSDDPARALKRAVRIVQTLGPLNMVRMTLARASMELNRKARTPQPPIVLKP